MGVLQGTRTTPGYPFVALPGLCRSKTRFSVARTCRVPTVNLQRVVSRITLVTALCRVFRASPLGLPTISVFRSFNRLQATSPEPRGGKG